jgi:lipoprotein-releasing system permease protein
MKLSFLIQIALRQLVERKRQSVVSFFGIVLGVAFYLAVSSLMRGSEKDFIRRLVDNSPHITISDEFRNSKIQPIQKLYPSAAFQITNVKPMIDKRGIRGKEAVLEYLKNVLGFVASPVLVGQALVDFAGQDNSVTLNGMSSNDIKEVTTLEQFMVEGSIEEIASNLDGIIIGFELKKVINVALGDNIRVSSANGQNKIFKVVGVFRSGRSSQDRSQVYLDISRVQALLDKQNRINSIIIKVPDPYKARDYAKKIEDKIRYKSVSWQETSEDLMNTIGIRNKIMYTVVSAVLIVAAFGIYNVISTVVIEKYRDIAILKSIGFYPSEIKIIFSIQGIILGIFGCIFGVPLGTFFMFILQQVKIKPPGATEFVSMPIDWGATQFFIAIAFAMTAAFIASYLPSKKASHVQPVDVLRGGSW